ncbi:MAG: adenylate/guanylate cyclase domain-containing protein, partial [Terriglobales bacterium]
MPAAHASTTSFEEHLAREIGASERLRAAVLVWILVALMVFLVIGYALFREQYREQYRELFATPAAGIYLLASLALLLCYEVAILWVLGRRPAGESGVRAALRYLNAFIEASVPSVIILAVASEISPVFVLQSAAILLYAVFIVLSTLLLDYRLSAFTGLVAAAEYVGLCIAFLGRSGEAAAGTPFELPPFYIAKGAILVLCGLAAGFVAHQLKRRVGNVFRTMQERQRVLDAFGQQVSPAIAEELLKAGPEIASRRAAVCVLFMDIRNFTPLVERKSPEEIVAFQNAVFAEAVEVVNRNQGIINQFLGDGFMASFGAPITTGRDCANALAAAGELVAGMRALASAGRIPPISIGVGIHAGEAVSGNVGSESRRQYSITGNVVILASRIEQLNKEYGSQILASREVLE